MPADDVEIREGDEEGLHRFNSLGPVQVLRDAAGKVTGVEFKHVVRVFDENRKFNPTFDESRRTVIEADTVLLSIGQAADLSFLDPQVHGIQTTGPGILKLDPATLATTVPGVFAAGDLARHTPDDPRHRSGKKAARSVYEFVTGKTIQTETIEVHQVLENYRREKDYEKPHRFPIPVLSVQERLACPTASVERGYTDELARREASRAWTVASTPSSTARSASSVAAVLTFARRPASSSSR